MTDLQGKIAVVTGAGKGIGRAIAFALAKAGARLVIAARTESDLHRVAEEIAHLKGEVLAVRTDVSKERDVDQLAEKTLSRFERVDILVNNAGTGVFAKVVEMGVADFDRMFATNMRGVFLCTKAFLPAMVGQRSGDIINIGSLAGRNAFVGGGGYAATKWALIGFSRSLMLEVREYDIRVITVCPGSVDTSFDLRAEANQHERRRLPKAEDIAQVVLGALVMPRNVMVSEIDVRPTNPSWKS